MDKRSRLLNPARYLSHLSQEQLTLEKIGLPDSQTWSVRSKEGSFVLKTIQKTNCIRLSCWLSRYYLRKETLLYQQLCQLQLRDVHIPALIKYQPRHFLLVEKIEQGRKGWHREQISPKQLVQALLEFHQLQLKAKPTGLFPHIIEAKNSLTGKTILWSFTRVLPGCGLKALFQTLRLITTCLKQQKRFKQPVLLHHDLLRRNNMLSTDKGLYLIDFESVRYEHRWVLHDIIDVALYQKQFKLNRKLLRAYLQKLVSLHPEYRQLNLSANIRMVMLHRFMARILPEGKHDEDLRDRWFEFYQQVLLSQRAFDQWYKETVDL